MLWEYNAKYSDKKSARSTSRTMSAGVHPKTQQVSPTSSPNDREPGDNFTDFMSHVKSIGGKRPSLAASQRRLQLFNVRPSLVPSMRSSTRLPSSSPSFTTGRESQTELTGSMHALAGKSSTSGGGAKKQPVPTHFMMRYRKEGCFSKNCRPSSTDHVGALMNIPSWEHRKTSVFGRTFYEHYP